jgi:phosphate transport system protein
MAHIERALDHELANIKNLLTSMGGKVQYMLENSTKALVERDTRLAEEIIQFDKEVDRLELVIDQAIYELIALRQPAASDLRMVLAGIKINNDLERMGDYCEGICRQAISLNKMPALPQTKEFEKLAMLASRQRGFLRPAGQEYWACVPWL